jgi:hypothetical protein
MNRTVLFGGVAAVVVLLGTAGYLIFAGRGPAGTGVGTGTEVDGPVTANPVSVITEHTNNLSQDGKRLNLGFPGFELKAGAGQTTSSVFSTTWNIKVRCRCSSVNKSAFSGKSPLRVTTTRPANTVGSATSSVSGVFPEAKAWHRSSARLPFWFPPVVSTDARRASVAPAGCQCRSLPCVPLAKRFSTARFATSMTRIW